MASASGAESSASCWREGSSSLPWSRPRPRTWPRSSPATRPRRRPPLVNYWFRPTASDPNGDPLTFAASGVPKWARFDRRTGVLSGKPASRDIGTVSTVRIRVSDGKLSSNLPQFTITVAKSQTTNGAPTIGGTPASAVVEGVPYGFVPTAKDPEGQTLTFSIVNKPSWATFTSSSGQLSGTPPVGSAGSYPNVTISVTDGTNKVSLAPFSITVNPKPNGAPTIGGTPASAVVEGAPYGFVPTAKDPEGQTLTFSIVNMPGLGHVLEFLRAAERYAARRLRRQLPERHDLGHGRHQQGLARAVQHHREPEAERRAHHRRHPGLDRGRGRALRLRAHGEGPGRPDADVLDREHAQAGPRSRVPPVS